MIYHYRLIVDGEPIPVTLSVETNEQEARAALRLIAETAKRYGMELEPIYPDDLPSERVA
jgi:hypothetical protein